ncbi:MAG: hypothetical protein M1404_00860 [Acidobacteria bacterium]|nr:hypothetical protein [Acidobacteriota bacterium]
MTVHHDTQEAGSGDASTRKVFADSPDVVLVALLVLCATLPYLNTLFNGFVYDDNRQVLDNPYLRSFHYLPKVFGTTAWSFVGAQGVSNYYRPDDDPRLLVLLPGVWHAGLRFSPS